MCSIVVTVKFPEFASSSARMSSTFLLPLVMITTKLSSVYRWQHWIILKSCKIESTTVKVRALHGLRNDESLNWHKEPWGCQLDLQSPWHHPAARPRDHSAGNTSPPSVWKCRRWLSSLQTPNQQQVGRPPTSIHIGWGDEATAHCCIPSSHCHIEHSKLDHLLHLLRSPTTFL